MKEYNNNCVSEIIGIIVLLILVCYWDVICFMAIMFGAGYICVKFNSEIKRAINAVVVYFKNIFKD